VSDALVDESVNRLLQFRRHSAFAFTFAFAFAFAFAFPLPVWWHGASQRDGKRI
jgi:hypothetical protein